MIYFNKNKLINETLDKYYDTFSHTLDTTDFVPEKYNKKICKYIFKNMKKTFRKINKEDRKFQREFNKNQRKLKKLKKKTRKKILKNQQKTNKNSKNKVGVIKLDTDSNSKS